jgi:dynein heavy chain
VLKDQFQDVFDSYMRAMREAALLYILRSPEERKRLHILVLPQVRQTSALRFAKMGGYDRVKFQDHHRSIMKAKMAIADGK